MSIGCGIGYRMLDESHVCLPFGLSNSVANQTVLVSSSVVYFVNKMTISLKLECPIKFATINRKIEDFTGLKCLERTLTPRLFHAATYLSLDLL